MHQLQQGLGNRAFGRFIQAKLKISEPGDEYELEADRVADLVMRSPCPAPKGQTIASHEAQGPELQRKCDACKQELSPTVLDWDSEPQLARKCTDCEQEEKESVQLKNSSGASPAVAPIVGQGNGGGRPLDSSVLAFFEPKFGYSFDGVRIHTDGAAAESARVVRAQAYTIGRDIVFGPEQYQPHTIEGQRLLAHELTHVVQQGGRSKLRRINRAEAASETPAEATPGQPASPGARLLSLIGAIEEIHARANQAVNGDQAPNPNASGAEAAIAGLAGPVNMIPGLLNKMRDVANGDNEELKLQTLAAFSPEKVRQATDDVERSHHIAQTTPVPVQEEQPEQQAASLLHVSHPQDAAELEAVRVADAMVSGGSPVAVDQTANRKVIHRSNGAAAALATLTAFELGGGAEAEAATGPPGWVVGGVILLAMAGLAIYVASTTTTTTAPPTATSVPTTRPTATTTTAAPPITGTRTRPGQTCDDVRLVVLEAAKSLACAGPFSCSDSVENLGKRNERLLSCAQILANIAAINACLAARNLIQSECFTGSPEAGHAAQVAQLTNALATCTAKSLARGC